MKNKTKREQNIRENDPASLYRASTRDLTSGQHYKVKHTL